MPERPLTLMAVHAHPDDEAISTGGVLARYSAEGVRTVLVTCTNGELGDAPGGIKPGEPGHDEAVVVPLRRHELEASCEVLGVSNLELLYTEGVARVAREVFNDELVTPVVKNALGDSAGVLGAALIAR